MAHTRRRVSSRRISGGGLDFIVIIVVPIYFTWNGALTLTGDELLCLWGTCTEGDAAGS